MHEMGVNGATDTVTNANPPPRTPDTGSSKEVKEFKEAVDRSTTSNDSAKQSQGASNTSSSYPMILATKPPINLARGTGNQGAPSQAGSAAAAAGKTPAATTQTTTGTGTPPPKDAAVDKDAKVATPQSGATAAGAADDNSPHLEVDAQALAVANQSPDHLKSFGSLDVSASAVWKNKNLVLDHTFASGNSVSIGHEPQVGVTVSSHVKDPSDATTPGVTRPPAVSVHPQVSAQVGIANYTIKHGKDDFVEFELDATAQVDLYGGKPQLQGSLQPGVELHITDKVSAVGQVSIPFATAGGQNPPPSAGIGIKVTAF
jgi:hypothetical protein